MNGFRISKRRVSTAAVVSAVLFIGLLAGAVLSSTAGASGGGLHSSPDAKLTNGEVVYVYGRNLNPGDEIILIQCLRSATTLTGCDPATATTTPSTVSANGKLGATAVTVATGDIGTGTCGTSKSDVADCMIAAEDLSSPSTLGSFVAYVNIRFAKPVATTTTTALSTTAPSIPTSTPSIPATSPSLPAGSAPTLSVRQ